VKKIEESKLNSPYMI